MNIEYSNQKLTQYARRVGFLSWLSAHWLIPSQRSSIPRVSWGQRTRERINIDPDHVLMPAASQNYIHCVFFPMLRVYLHLYRRGHAVSAHTHSWHMITERDAMSWQDNSDILMKKKSTFERGASAPFTSNVWNKNMQVVLILCASLYYTKYVLMTSLLWYNYCAQISKPSFYIMFTT